MNGLRHRLGETGQAEREEAVTAERRALLGAPAVERQRVQHHVVAGAVEPRQREEQAVEQVCRSHESVDHAQRRVRPVVVAPMLGVHNVIAVEARHSLRIAGLTGSKLLLNQMW